MKTLKFFKGAHHRRKKSCYCIFSKHNSHTSDINGSDSDSNRGKIKNLNIYPLRAARERDKERYIITQNSSPSVSHAIVNNL